MPRKGDSAKRYRSGDEGDVQDNHEDGLPTSQPPMKRGSQVSLRMYPSPEEAKEAKDLLEAREWAVRPTAQFLNAVTIPATTSGASFQAVLAPAASNPSLNSETEKIAAVVPRLKLSKENRKPGDRKKAGRLHYAEEEFGTPVPTDNESEFLETETDSFSEFKASRPFRDKTAQGSIKLKKPIDDNPDVKAPKRQSTGSVRERKSAKAKAGPKYKWTAETMNELPPLTSIDDIFTDIAKRNPALEHVAAHLNGRPLRVATMCSGTESPLIALGLITSSMKTLYGADLTIEHVFSCEIEPFKQAYIERNFRPPILFRDVCELGNESATTAYGAKVRVPGNCDLLVAGTSCVDYSNLNNHGKGLNDGGESGRTFWGMFSWVQQHRPKIVILENVSSAPWDQVAVEFSSIGYSADWNRFDTKNYYIPHTRQRGYLVAFDTNDPKLPAMWVELVNELTRPASVSFEAFLLDDDDPRVTQARQKLVREEGGRAKGHEWTACEIRHAHARTTEGLGRGRPFTEWRESGYTKYPDYAWTEWAPLQVPRVHDLIDISVLRNCAAGKDIPYQARVWNLSQNVDRDTEGKSTGITQCLTPTMIPFLTARGGPMTGYELLGLQGISASTLNLTKETEANLKDLAGNAMSSTVVGTAIISALIVGTNLLEKNKARKITAPENKPLPVESFIKIPDQLVFKTIDLASTTPRKIKRLLRDARKSLRMCVCEGRALISNHPIQKCRCCGHTACGSCAGKPTHDYIQTIKDRTMPGEFARAFKNSIPMLLNFENIEGSVLAAIQQVEHLPVQNKDWDLWEQYVCRALGATFYFSGIKRQEIWLASYENPYSRLELRISAKNAEWRVFVKPDHGDEKWKDLRRLFGSRPVAQMKVDRSGTSLLTGQWSIGIPCLASIGVIVKGRGHLVDSWEKSMGLTDPAFSNKMVWSELEIELCDPSQGALIDRDISGCWTLLPRCGTATRALHKKVSGKPLFLFFDPLRLGDGKNDRFVISKSCKRLAYGEYRPLVASFDPEFRPDGTDEIQTQLTIETFWVASNGLTLLPHQNAEVEYSLLDPSQTPPGDGCDVASPLLVAVAPITFECIESRSPTWSITIESQSQKVFESISWLIERMKSDEGVGPWTEYNLQMENDCSTCAPSRPTISWSGKDKSGPIEDPEESAVWERAMKARPASWTTAIKVDHLDRLHLYIGLNLLSLSHRAAALVPEGTSLGPLRIFWRFVTGYVEPPRLNPPAFTVRSNRGDIEAKQPPGFMLALRPEQLRSLSWMIHRESPEAAGFMEEEVVEATHSQLGWRVDVKAQRTNKARGGVLADAVGYGKTAIILGLIAHQKGINATPSDTQGLIPLKGTLVIVPGHLTTQWETEARKFTANLFKIISIKTMSNLTKLPMKTLMGADIIIVAGSLFRSPSYLQRVAELSGGPEAPPPKSGRKFHHWLQDIMKKVKQQAACLQTGRIADVIELINAGCEEREKARVAGRSAAPGLSRKTQNKVASCNRKGSKKVDCSDESEFESDEPAKGKKKPTSNTADPHKYEDARWKLNSNGRRDWREMICPPLELFYFNRLVVDEFTYYADAALDAIPNLSSANRWVLSGTPPLGDFADVKKIARFLGVRLGVDDDTANSDVNNRKIAKERSAVESFEAFKEIRSVAWHENRHQVAQVFLDTCIRQNVAEIDEIPWVESFIRIRLPAAERAIYIELQHHIDAMDMKANSKFTSKSGGDREVRLQSAIGGSGSTDEALLKSVCHFSLNLQGLGASASAGTACGFVVQERRKQLEETRIELQKNLRDTMLLCKRFKHDYISKHDLSYRKDLDDKQKTTLGDEEATAVYQKLIQDAKHWAAANANKPKVIPSIMSEPEFSTPKKKEGLDSDEESGQKVEEKAGPDTMVLLRTIQLRLSKLTKELAGRCRSLRFFETVLSIHADRAKFNSCRCGPKNVTFEDIMVSSSCGHVACKDCMSNGTTVQGQCPEYSNGCHVQFSTSSLISASALSASSDALTKFGAKLDALVELIQNHIPPDERVLVMVQYPDLLKKVDTVLQAAGITASRLAGDARTKANELTAFQTSNSSKVLLLEVTAETAAGANLTVANHIIFLSPLCCETEQEYRASETQAIGRIRRYGQQRVVHIWRLFAEDTIDEKIYETRGNPVR
ncbi:hypothetical protein ABW19_dt0209882 [Dactylella cylindrospora]|nr:hypothetical protein ABW19_dt0209882 [Dactylella cylindrospora]